MDFYIGLGGIGCRTVKAFARDHHVDISQCYFIDCDREAKKLYEPSQTYVIDNKGIGTATRRSFGRHMIKYEIYNGRFQEFFSKIRNSDSVSLTFVVGSFGGFGGAAVTELFDYLDAITWGRAERTSKVIAFNESFTKAMGFPPGMIGWYESNTMDLLGEFSGKYKEEQWPVLPEQRTMYHPKCELYLIDTKDMAQEEFGKILTYPSCKLAELDVKKRYKVKSKKNSPPVFISYSSKDQVVADDLVNCLKKRGMHSWIATKDIREGSYAKQIIQGIRDAKIFIVILSKNSIASEQVKNEIDRAFHRLKEGLKLVPFLVDDAELDDECSYYLCRQEMFFGKTPPIHDRIEEFALKVADMLE